jgi:hypothetical protein
MTTKYYKLVKKARNMCGKFGNIFKKLAKIKKMCYNGFDTI